MTSLSPLISENPIFSKLTQNLIDSYEQFLSELREDISEDEVSPYLSTEFQEELKGLIQEKELNTYSPLKFYWLNLIDKIVDTLALVDEEIENPEELIGAFSESDLLGFVVELLEKGDGAESVLQQVLEFQELQVVSFYRLHISKENWQPSGPVSYSLTPEIGESNGTLVLGENKDIYRVEDLRDETIVPIVGYFPLQKNLQIMIGEEVKTIQAEEPSLKHVINGLTILPGVKQDNSISDSHFNKCQKAINVIENLSSGLSDTFKKFSHTITPIFEEEIVSYSMAILPGFSCINMENRDFVDMVDDLLHENGHHFLNAALEGEEEIIYEDDDKIFYSPWRRALRPIRGLYHGTVTFYWAYRLFKELSLWEKLSEYFNQDEVQKIYFRFLEESVMLMRCQSEVTKAHEMGKVTDYGLKITSLVFEEIEKDKSLERLITDKLNDSYKNQLIELRETMSSARGA